MAKAPTSKNQAASAEKAQVSFEEAMENLEDIVERMESGELSLEELMNYFEDGAKLVKLCQNHLNRAETRIMELEKQSDGQWQEKPASIPNTD